METINVGTRLAVRDPFIMVTAHAEITVADGKQRLGLRLEARIKFRLDDFPFIDRVDMGRWI